MWLNSKTQNGTKLKNPQCDKNKKKCDKTHKLELREEKIRNSNCDKTQKLILWLDSETQIGTKPNNQRFKKLKKKHVLLITIWYLDYKWNVFKTAFCNLTMFCLKKFFFFFLQFDWTFLSHEIFGTWLSWHTRKILCYVLF